MSKSSLPGSSDLEAAYEQLLHKQILPNCEDLVSWTLWSRLDARLGEILCVFFSKRFAEINPFELWRANLTSKCPQALGVLLEFAISYATKNRKNLRAWSLTVMAGVNKAEPQMYFINDGAPKPERDRSIFPRNLLPYRRWGFIGQENLIPKESAFSTLLSREHRQALLAGLIAQGRPFSTQDYIAVCENRIHRRTAERDLESSPNLRKKGHTRARTYIPRLS